MNKELLIFVDNGSDKRKFFCHKNPVLINDIDLYILISNKVSFGKKFISGLLVT